MAPSSYNTTFGKLKNFQLLYSKKGRGGARLRSPFFHMNEKILKTRIKQRRDTVANWTKNNPVLLKGEIAIVEDTDGAIRFKVGDGNKTFSALAYTDEKLKAEIATKGNKLAEAGSETLPVYIKSDGTASAIKKITEKHVDWSNNPNEYKRGNISPLMTAMSPYHAVNRFAIPKPAGITIEYSNDNQNTWVDYGATDEEKMNLTSNNRSTFYLGKKLSGQTINDALRITLNATNMGVYCALRDLLIFVSTLGPNRFFMKMEYSHKSDETVFTEINYHWLLEGWSGWNDIPIYFSAFGGSAHQTTNYAAIRLTFYHDPNEDISKIGNPFVSYIIGLATHSWSRCSNMATDNHIYSWDVNQNAIFPAKIIGDYEPSTPASALTSYTALSGRGATNDLNQSLSRGISYYADENATNIPSDAGKYGTLVNLLNEGETQNNTNNWLTQIASTTTNRLFSRTKINNENFSKWEEIIKIADDDYFVLDGGTSTTVI